MDNHTVPTPPEPRQSHQGGNDTQRTIHERYTQALDERDAAREALERVLAAHENSHDLCDADLERTKAEAYRWYKHSRTLGWVSAAWFATTVGLGATLALVLTGVIG